MTTIRPQSRVVATVYTHTDRLISLTPWLTGYRVNEHQSQPVWPISLSLKWSSQQGDLRKLIRDDDWLVIEEHGPKGVRVHVALVDSVRRRRQVTRSGAVVRMWTIQASHVGKPFAVHECRFSSLLPQSFPGFLGAEGSDFETIAQTIAPSNYAPRDILRTIIQWAFRPKRITKATANPTAPGGVVAEPPPPPPAVKKQQLTANFHINEFLNNKDTEKPNEEQQANLQQLAEYLQILRDNYLGGAAVSITPIGGWCGRILNKAKGRNPNTTRHGMGKAADITVAGKTPLQVATAISQAIAAGDLPASYGCFIYKSFVHFDIGVTGDGGENRPIWAAGTPKDPTIIPTAAQVAAFMAIKPVPGTGTTTTSTDVGTAAGDAAETNKQIAPDPPPESVTVSEGLSGDGAFVVPPGLARGAQGASRPTQTPQGAAAGPAPRWDWLDVCDLYTYNDAGDPNDPTHAPRIKGRWWRLHSLNRMGKTIVDPLIRPQTDPAFNEYFYDTRRVGTGSGYSKLARFLGGWAPVVVFRRRPLDKADWDRVPECVIPWADVTDDDLGRGGAERFDFFYARQLGSAEYGGPVMDEELKGGNGRIPAIDLGDFAIHGQRSMDVEAQFAWSPALFDDEAAAEGDDIITQVADFTETLHRWNRPLPIMDGGTITVPWLDADALVGHKVKLTGTSVDGEPPSHGYIEGVSKSFVVEPGTGAVQASTTITVTRLQPLDTYAAPGVVSWKA